MNLSQESNDLEQRRKSTTKPIQDRIHFGNIKLERLPEWVRTRRHVITLVLAAFLLFSQLLEYWILRTFGETALVWFSILFYLLLVPISAWILIGHLESDGESLELSNLHANRTIQFSQQLGDAQNWEELVQRTVEYAHLVAPKAYVTLFVYNPYSMRMLPEAACTRDGKIIFHPVTSINPDTLPLGSLPQLLRQTGSSNPFERPAVLGEPAPARIDPLPPNRYDLPVVHKDQQIGVLKLDYTKGSGPSKDEIRDLKNVAPVIALALEGAQLQNLAVEQAAASEAQRQQIAQNLHDSLAQNISYLRLKLDQLTGENAIREIGVVLQELEHMRASAEEAYQQVRDTLSELNSAYTEDFSGYIDKHGKTIGARSGFTYQTRLAGAPFFLPAEYRQQILFIVREALHNIEKHAFAHNVLVQILWLEAELIVKITDDGVGFNPLTVQTDGHYGLWIMQNRAQEIGGTLKIMPAEVHGTEVTLWVPRPVHHLTTNS